MRSLLKHVIHGDEGQDLLEYSMLVFLIAVAALVMLSSVGNLVSNTFWQFISANVAANL
jgi:Flp pilus assembly pilin Flp